MLRLLSTRVKIYSQANYQTLKKGQSFDKTKISFIIEQVQNSKNSNSIQNSKMLMVDSFHSSNVCTMKTVKTILTHGHASLWRKLSEVVNFPLWYFYNLFWTQKELIIHISNGVSMNCCKFLEKLKSEINSLYHVKNTQKPFPTGQHCFWKYCQTNSFNDFHVILERPPVSKMKLLEKCHWHCSVNFIVPLVFIAALDVSVMGEMILQWVSYFCQNNVKQIFKSVYI